MARGEWLKGGPLGPLGPLVLNRVLGTATQPDFACLRKKWVDNLGNELPEQRAAAQHLPLHLWRYNVFFPPTMSAHLHFCIPHPGADFQHLPWEDLTGATGNGSSPRPGVGRFNVFAPTLHSDQRHP